MNLQESSDAVQAFASDRHLEYPILLDTDGQVGARFNVRTIPAVVLIDPDGTIRYSGHRLPDVSRLEPYMQPPEDEQPS